MIKQRVQQGPADHAPTHARTHTRAGSSAVIPGVGRAPVTAGGPWCCLAVALRIHLSKAYNKASGARRPAGVNSSVTYLSIYNIY